MIKEKDGYKYSFEQFEEYSFRHKFIVYSLGGKQGLNKDIYTTNPNKQEVEDMFLSVAMDKIANVVRDLSDIINTTKNSRT